MAQLVHSKCSGMLPIRVSKLQDSSSPSAVMTSWPQHHALGRWLAKHTHLCSSTDIRITQEALPHVHGAAPILAQAQAAYSVVEALIAAGLEAAAAGPGCCSQPRTTRQQAAAAHVLYPSTAAEAAAAIAAAAAAVAPAYAPSSSSSSNSSNSSSSTAAARTMGLAHFACSIPISGRLLSALASYTQLTSLQLQVNPQTPAGTRAAAVAGIAGLASLTRLQELALSIDNRTSYRYFQSNGQAGGSHAVFDAVQPVLQSLTRLTSLTYGWVPEEQLLHSLPASLRKLKLTRDLSGLQLTHLTRVTNLNIVSVHNGSTFPPMLQTLEVAGWLRTALPLLQLQRLQQLVLRFAPDAACLQELALVTQLSRIDLSCSGTVPLSLPGGSGLCRLPLKSLSLKPLGQRLSSVASRLEAPTLAVVGGCTQLTALNLSMLALRVPVEEFVTQLKKLSALCDLSLICLRPPPVTSDNEDGVWGPLWRFASELLSLRRLVVHQMQLGRAGVASLAAATQLTYLEVVGCWVGGAAETELRAGLRHIGGSALVVRPSVA